jgi:activating signal cointegrator 1
MKAISLHQPWASAIALGNKSIETRHWKPKHRGEIAIHAAKTLDCEFAAAERSLGRLPARLPLGAIVAVATLVDCRPTHELKLEIGAIERLYGNYEPGRWGWMLEDIRVLAEPVGAVGRQSLFSIDGEILAAVRAQL